jgi:hypothetical protein
MSGTEWSDQENDLIVADYFDMLGAELRGEKRSKARHRRALVSLLNQRTEGSVEFKHQNISAVLLGLGQPWIVGYKPASQFQLSLVDAVMRLLESRSDWLLPQRNRPEGSEGREKGWGESGVPLWIGPPPTVSNAPPPIDPERMAFIARKYDVAERDARNRALGKAGEEIVLNHETATLKAAGRNDLAAKVRWTAQDDGDGLGFDIQSFEPNGRPRLIEVKTTNGWERTPFHITRTELAAAEAHRDQWHLIRIWNFAREPRAFGIRPPLGQHIELTPTSFLAAIR